MDILDTLLLNTIGKVLRFLLIGAMVVSLVYGLVTLNFRNAVDLWTTQISLITEPLFNYFTERAEHRMEAVLEAAFSRLNKE